VEPEDIEQKKSASGTDSALIYFWLGAGEKKKKGEKIA